MSAKLYTGNNTHSVEVDGLTNESDGELIDDADVSVTVYKSDGVTAVAGPAWPVTLTALGDGGFYSGTFNAYDNIEERCKYIIKISIESDGNYAEFSREVMAETRKF